MTTAKGGLFGEGVFRFDEIDTTIATDLRRELTIGADDPLSARYRLTQSYEMGREGWRIRIETETSMSATKTDFRIVSTLRALRERRRGRGARVGRDDPARFACKPLLQRPSEDAVVMTNAQPNILIVMVDQLAPAFLPPYGDKLVVAPNIAALGGERRACSTAPIATRRCARPRARCS